LTGTPPMGDREAARVRAHCPAGARAAAMSRSPHRRTLLLAAALALATGVASCRGPAGGREPRAAVRIERLTPTPFPAEERPLPPAATPGVPPSPAAATGTPAAPVERRPAPVRLAPPVVPPASPGRPLPGREDPLLVAAIARALGEDADRAGVVVKRLTDGVTAHWNADRVYYAASLYKLEVLYEAYRQRAVGALDFDAVRPLDERYLAEDLGTAVRLPLTPDGSLTVRQAVAAMVTYSDNTSATLLLDLLGHRNIDATMAALGLTVSSVNTTELPTTATDMARVMEAIVRGEGLDATAAQEMVALLLAQENRAGIPRGVPAGVAVGNKWGGWDGYVHDVAIVLAPGGAYVIAVLTDGTGWDAIARVSRAVYDYFASLGPSAGSR
jgi:beta-lactamase class A